MHDNQIKNVISGAYVVTVISPDEPSSNITIDHNYFTNPGGGGVFISPNQKNVKIAKLQTTHSKISRRRQ
jgi:hypothetical protein